MSITYFYPYSKYAEPSESWSKFIGNKISFPFPIKMKMIR